VNVYQKLNAARSKFHESEIKKTGFNKFAQYYYFELADFVVPALRIFNDVGLTAITTFQPDMATMEVINTEKPEEKIVFVSPMSEASLKGCHPVQNLGAVQTYIRRYLWTAALEIVEHDALDSAEPVKVIKPEPEKPKQKVIAGRYVEVDPKHALFVDAMIGWSQNCTEVAHLADLWKSNQDTVDELKAADPEQFKRLQEHFAAIKHKLTTEEVES
jgi:hypothetical protein